MAPKTSGKAAKEAGEEAQKSNHKVNPRRRGKRRQEATAIYIYKVLKSSTSRTLSFSPGYVHMQLFPSMIFSREIAARVFSSCSSTQSASTINIPGIQMLSGFSFPGDSAKHASV
ncbi:UNVERIFIED_CONTAM: hypothetical protein GTU68_024270 [Idotea baltica]|nr:hypothetical protein [Idotea baltica]